MSREMLEKAAKAAGMETRWDQPRGAKTGILRARVPGSGDAFPYWNPLTDDGDALRLAVKLRIHITMNAFGAAASGPNAGEVCSISEIAPDVFAATRLAITRAAAAIYDATHSGRKE